METDILSEQVIDLTAMMQTMNETIIRLSTEVAKLKTAASPTKSIGGGSVMTTGSRFSTAAPVDYVPFAIAGSAVFEGLRRHVFFGKNGAKLIQPTGDPNGIYIKGHMAKYINSSVKLASTFEAIDDFSSDDGDADSL
jgi:hypothetical protein